MKSSLAAVLIVGMLSACDPAGPSASPGAESSTPVPEDSSSESSSSGPGSASSSTPSPEPSAAPEPGSTTVTVWSAVDRDVKAGLQKALTKRAAQDGITIRWRTVKDLNTSLMQSVTIGDTPDIAIVSTPGALSDLVSRGGAYRLDGVLDMSALQSSMTPGTLEAGTVQGSLYGLMVSMSVKGLVYYPKQAWNKAGYKVPRTISALNKLTAKIKSDGTTPWCMGIYSGPATGWPATDWFETLIMKFGGADGYNSWVSHETPFNSDLVKQAGAEFEKLLFTKGNVVGGRRGMLYTPFGAAANPMFDNPPGCYLFNQGSFITAGQFFPKDIRQHLDQSIGVFGFPPVTTGGENPIEGGGDMAVMMNNTGNVQKVMGYLSQASVGKYAAANSSFISPHTDFKMSLYSSNTIRTIAKIAYTSTDLLFDGSDQMPTAVSVGTFFTNMTKYVRGAQSLNTTLTKIDNSWPSN